VSLLPGYRQTLPLTWITLVALTVLIAPVAAPLCASDRDRERDRERLIDRIDELRDLIQATESKLLRVTIDYKSAKQSLDEATTDHRDAQRTLSASRVRAKEAHQAETRAILELKRRAAADERAIEAKEAVEWAQVAVEVARKRALKPLEADAEFVEARDALRAAQAEVERLKKAGAAAGLRVAAMRVIELDAVVSRLQRKALDADEVYVAAQRDLVLANTKLANVSDRIDQELKTDFTRVQTHRAARRADEQEKLASADLRRKSVTLRRADQQFRRVSDDLRRTESQLDYFRGELRRATARLNSL